MPIDTEIQFTSRRVKLPKAWILQAVNQIASDYGWTEGEISITIVDDPQIHQVNRQYLNHDYPTDVISFQLGFDDSDSALTDCDSDTPLAAGAAI
ncbi:MAG: hypothetical protein EBU88_16765, partial [Acidobacteria bacterium]|nr:hypothetical protein [Acidobacteriota bacterium]